MSPKVIKPFLQSPIWFWWALGRILDPFFFYTRWLIEWCHRNLLFLLKTAYIRKMYLKKKKKKWKPFDKFMSIIKILIYAYCRVQERTTLLVFYIIKKILGGKARHQRHRYLKTTAQTCTPPFFFLVLPFVSFPIFMILFRKKRYFYGHLNFFFFAKILIFLSSSVLDYVLFIIVNLKQIFMVTT